jgi:glycosyltransferase involved in cell wall biosynthesis
MKHSKLVSIIVPWDRSFNDEYINFYLQTILEQNYRNLEVIIVANKLEEKQLKISYKIFPDLKYIALDYGHTFNAYNIGLELATGKFLAFIDSKNFWLPDKLTIQMAAFESYSELDGVFGYISRQLVDRSSEDLPDLSEEAFYQAKTIPGYIPGTMLIKRQAWKKVGEFSESFLTWHQRAMKLQLTMLMLPVIVAKTQIELSSYQRNRAEIEYA